MKHMSILFLLIGFIVKISTGLDDALIHIPIVSNISKSRAGKISYAIGFMIAVLVAILISITLAEFIKELPYHNFIASGLIFMFAIVVYFNLFSLHLDNIKKPNFRKITPRRIAMLIGMGFTLSLITIIDDVLVFSSLFISSNAIIYTVIGIIISAILEIGLIMFVSQKVKSIKYNKEISTIILIGLGILVLFKLI